jgi:hypothetical protein
MLKSQSPDIKVSERDSECLSNLFILVFINCKHSCEDVPYFLVVTNNFDWYWEDSFFIVSWRSFTSL